MTPEEIVKFLQARRFPLTMESELHAAIVTELMHAGVSFEREVVLGPGERVDIMIGGTAIELKTKGSRREMYRQCERYAKHDRVKAIVLASRTHIGLPAPTVNGKPILVANLSRAFL